MNVVVARHTRACGDQLTDQDVLLKAKEIVDLALDRCLGQNLGGFLEGSGGEEGFGLQRCLGGAMPFVL